jgi:Tol biopolymer transport system component
MPTHSNHRARSVRVFLLAAGAALALSLGIAAVGLASSAKTTLVSVNSSGEQADGFSMSPSISADGRYVTFSSGATNLARAPYGVFVRDRKTGRTSLVSVRGEEAAISADGRFVAYSTEFPPGNTFVYAQKSGKTRLVSRDRSGHPAGEGGSAVPSISGDGRYIAFTSAATDLTRKKLKASRNTFVRDMKTGKIEQVNVSSSGKPGNHSCPHPSISANGRYVACESKATNLVKGATGSNIFVRDLRKHKTKLASVSSAGKEANAASYNPSISGDARYVAFESTASNLVKHDTNKSSDIFRRDLEKGKTKRISVNSKEKQANGDSAHPSISNHGGFIAFYSAARNLVTGDTNKRVDAFFRNEHTGKTKRVSVSSSGTQANGGSSVVKPSSHSLDAPPLSISADGRFVAFGSVASNLVRGDTNGTEDVFLRGPLHG